MSKKQTYHTTNNILPFSHSRWKGEGVCGSECRFENISSASVCVWLWIEMIFIAFNLLFIWYHISFHCTNEMKMRSQQETPRPAVWLTLEVSRPQIKPKQKKNTKLQRKSPFSLFYLFFPFICIFICGPHLDMLRLKVSQPTSQSVRPPPSTEKQ